MINYIIDIITEESKKLIIESGIKDISKLSKRYQKAKIYFHQDLDGVTTALGMKSYLEQNGIKVVDSEIIQYGDKEFAIKKLDAEGDVMPVLVDFAHGKPMFVIHTDHHDTQAGVEQGTSTNFKSSRSNVETISQTVSPKDIFPTEDINLISTVDSANYAQYDITPEEVMNYLFKIDKNKTLQQNKMMMGMVTNKLLLAFKNKPEFLENIVMNANPSLLSILNYIKSQIKERGYADVDSLNKNKEDYVKSMKTNKNVKVDGSIIVQYGGGSMMKPGSYDRYTPFRNNPDADFLVIAWPLGLVQASCNPFKKERALKGINLGEIKDVVLNKWRSQLESKDIPLSTIKWISESGKSFGEDSVGFTFKDFNALYGKEFKNMENGEEMLKNIDQVMKKPFTSLSDNEMMALDNISVNAWDLITANSGGHKCITNISGLSYLGRSKRPPQGKYKYDSESEDSPYVKFTKMLQNEFVRVLKEKIDSDTEVMDDSDSYVKMDESSFRVNKSEMIKNPLKYINKNILNEQKISLPIIIKDGYTAPKGDGDALHSFERRRSDGFGGKMTTKIDEQLKKVWDAGINPDLVNLKIVVDSSKYTVNWEATIDESKDGKAYMGSSTRGSSGRSADRRALGQLDKLKRQLTRNGAQDITQVLDFVNPKGVYIRQYFFKYTLPEKYPPHKTKVSYDRTQEPLVVSLNTEDPSMETELSSNTDYSVCSGDSYKKGCKDKDTKYDEPNSEGIIYNIQGCIGTTQDGFFGKNTEKSLKDKFGKNEFKLSDFNSICKDSKIVLNKNSEIINLDDTKIKDNKSPFDLSQITDVSASSTYKRKNEKIDTKYFIVHHTAGGKKQQDIVNILNRRRLGIQWVIDREGKIFQTLPLKARGAHVIFIGRKAPKGLSNSNAEGVEIIANNDADVLEVQCKAALILVKKLGYSDSQIYGHGEVSTNKAADEGQKCKTYIKNNR